LMMNPVPWLQMTNMISYQGLVRTFLSPSLLKKKLKSENTSYSQIITTCRMRYAVNELMMDGKNISQVSQSCGYNSTSYFISVFKDFYGMTPLHYVSQHRERTVA
ncbi:helix-turn-helix domain-containing protein, partial [Escherichia coli]